MKKEFKFKPDHSNIEKLYHYAVYKFPKKKRNIEYDEVGQFVMYKKNKDTSIFYYVRATTGDLNYNVYKRLKNDFVPKIDKPIIREFKRKVYPDEKLKNIFDKVLTPVSR